MDVQQMQNDLAYIRGTVARQQRSSNGPAPVLWLWAIYVLVGYTLIDVRPAAASIFFLVAGIIGGFLSAFLSRRWARRTGESDPAMGRRVGLHFGVGVVLAIVAALATALVFKTLTGQQAGQLVVVMIGIVYFLAGVHIARYFLWLGPVLIAGGLAVGFVPHYGWTMLGAVIAIGLVLPTFFQHSASLPPQATESH